MRLHREEYDSPSARASSTDGDGTASHSDGDIHALENNAQQAEEKRAADRARRFSAVAALNGASVALADGRSGRGGHGDGGGCRRFLGRSGRTPGCGDSKNRHERSCEGNGEVFSEHGWMDGWLVW